MPDKNSTESIASVGKEGNSTESWNWLGGNFFFSKENGHMTG